MYLQTQISKELAKEVLSRGRVIFEKDGVKLVEINMTEDNLPLIRKLFKPGSYTLLRTIECYDCGGVGANDMRRGGIVAVLPSEDIYPGAELYYDMLEKEGYEVGESGAEKTLGCDVDEEAGVVLACDYEGYDFIDKEYNSFDEMIKDIGSHWDTYLSMVGFIVPVKG